MKTAVIYATLTGHSKKIAKAIAKEFDTEPINIKTAYVLKDIDLLFVVGGIYKGKSLNKMIAYIHSLDENAVKKAVMITSCATKETKQILLRELLTNNNVEVLEDEYICRGSFLFLGLGHPNQKEIAGAVDFAKKQYQIANN